MVAAALLLAAASDPPPPPSPPPLPPPSPPAALQPYVHDGQLEPGDFGWTRGRFSDAPPADRAAFVQIMQWAARCRDAALASTLAELAALDHVPIRPDGLTTGPLLCRQVQFLPSFDRDRPYAAFRQAVAEATPVGDTFLAATRVAAEAGEARSQALGDQLSARPLVEQMLRFGAIWKREPPTGFPAMSADALEIVQTRIAIATSAEDHANTEWLKAIVEKDGWPKISVVGRPAAASAWLLVQHADADPVFQLRVLRRMEPMLASGEASSSDYALLYDRVMLKLVGTQRYATQFACDHGKRVPLPLEDERAVAQWRTKAGLSSLADNLKRIDALYGPCPIR